MYEFSSYHAEKETCTLVQRGVAAIFGPQSTASADHIRSISDAVEVPFIDTRWNYKPSQRIPGVKMEEYTINLHPDVETLGRAYIDIIEQYGWDAITILYENNDSMMRLKAIFDKTSKISDNEQFSILTKELVNNENGYRDVSNLGNHNNETGNTNLSLFRFLRKCLIAKRPQLYLTAAKILWERC